MPHDLRHIPLCDLKPCKLNVRRHGPKDIDSLAASVAALGLIQPLLVRDSGSGFEIIAGQRRYLAIKRLNAEGAPETDTVPCVVMAATDDAEAIECSLAENVARLPMDELDQYEAFAALTKQGLDEADIASHFAISPQVVKRRLAIAHLHPDIRRLYRSGEIDAKTLHLLTLATRERQKAWLGLYRDPEQTAPPPWQLKAWLLGGVEISCAAALFDEALYQGGITADLFGDERYFTDPDEFWRLQNSAIAEARDRLLAAGWAEVHIIAPDQRFQAWDHDKAARAKGGAVYFDVAPDGHVVIHKGLLPRCVAQRAMYKAGACGDETDADVRERPEMSSPLANYVDLVRHSAVRLAVADAPKLALRLMLAHVIGGGRGWQVAAEPGQPLTSVIGDAIAKLPSYPAFAVRQTEVATLLGLDNTKTPIVRPDHSGARTAAIFERLLTLTDAEVTRTLAVVMAETLAAGTQLIDTLGTMLDRKLVRQAQPDETFFTLAKDREAVSAMLVEVVGEAAAKSYLTDTGPKKKAIIRKALDGDGRAKVDDWLPRYMAFPQSGYTGRPLRAGTCAQA